MKTIHTAFASILLTALTACSGSPDTSPDGAAATPGSGRGRVSAFVPGTSAHGVRVECTEFRRDEDVDASAGYLT